MSSVATFVPVSVTGLVVTTHEKHLMKVYVLLVGHKINNVELLFWGGVELYCPLVAIFERM